MKFTKWQGAGNDFLIFNDFEQLTEHAWQKLISRISDRHFGIGADGVMLVGPSPDPAYAAHMVYYNSDGSRAAMCGNGIRCFAAHLHRTGKVNTLEFSIWTDDGPKGVRLEVTPAGYQAEISMGMATFDADKVPVISDLGYMLDEPIEVLGKRMSATALRVGVPHLVIEVDVLDQTEVLLLGPALETHEAFPEKINVNFVKWISSSEIEVVTWERGAGLTLACGTGACASFYALWHNRKLDSVAVVHVPGGQLTLRLGADEEIFMTGPATPVAEIDFIL